jgi:uncharacterized RDD family membrane protein YckC
MAKQRFRDIKQGKSPQQKTKQKPSKDAFSIFADKRTIAKAFITDNFMLVTPILFIVFYLVMGGRDGFAANKLLGWVYIFVPLIFIQIVFITKVSQTPGMRAYDIKVVDIKTLEAPTFGQIVARQALTPLSLFAFGWLTMFFRRDHRMLHELLSQTAMIYVDNSSKARTKT